MKLGAFLEEFKGLSPDTDIIFGSGDLSFHRTKWRGESLLQIEFSEVYEVEKSEPYPSGPVKLPK